MSGERSPGGSKSKLNLLSQVFKEALMEFAERLLPLCAARGATTGLAFSAPSLHELVGEIENETQETLQLHNAEHHHLDGARPGSYTDIQF